MKFVTIEPVPLTLVTVNWIKVILMISEDKGDYLYQFNNPVDILVALEND